MATGSNRKWVFTLNGIDGIDGVPDLWDPSKMQHLVYQLEQAPSTGMLHLQGAVHFFEPYPYGRGEGPTWRRLYARRSMQKLPEGGRILQKRRVAGSGTVGAWEADDTGDEDGSCSGGCHGAWWEATETDSSGGACSVRSVREEPAGIAAGTGQAQAEGQRQSCTLLGDDGDRQDTDGPRPLERRGCLPALRHEDAVDGRVLGSEDRLDRRLWRREDVHPSPEEHFGPIPNRSTDKGGGLHGTRS